MKARMTSTVPAPQEATGESLAQAFRQAMRQLVSTVHLITANGPAGPVGMTATAAVSLSFEPLSVLVCVNRQASIYPVLQSAQRFCLNVLAAGQAEIADQFGYGEREAERFTVGDWIDFGGVPALQSAQSSILCACEPLTDYGSHGLIAGRVLDVRTDARPPLLYGNGGYVS